ncbi:DUF4426 domain-containing protein [Simiduia curdlanivorans]|uniref:DUF4426 domain-containing protein n=1 Tax=Simiduia curdlanivorans TaxID=1492769 RepID=A0ABV8V1Y5_9GAMM|nr:DUF4426 domain-containing protein [Simiduia curdlanivorans]MDN3637745.1 DUF4426 domain-containing protein [Simiduia curdlanivorans]
MTNLRGLITFFCLSLSLLAQAADVPDAKPMDQNPWFDSGKYRVHFSTFTSDFLQPETAAGLQLTRAKDQLLVNIAVTEKNADGSYSMGQTATVTGTATNLMQQMKPLSFVQVKEPNATYYLAPLRFSNEEIIHFNIQVLSEQGETLNVTFTRTLYVNNR